MKGSEVAVILAELGKVLGGGLVDENLEACFGDVWVVQILWMVHN